MQTFAAFGYQQIQVDASFLRLALRRFPVDRGYERSCADSLALVQNVLGCSADGERRIIESLVDEVISSAASRSVEAARMDASIVQTICERKLEKIGLGPEL